MHIPPQYSVMEDQSGTRLKGAPGRDFAETIGTGLQVNANVPGGKRHVAFTQNDDMKEDHVPSNVMEIAGCFHSIGHRTDAKVVYLAHHATRFLKRHCKSTFEFNL